MDRERPADPEHAIALQERLRLHVRPTVDAEAARRPAAVAGLDAAYSLDGRWAVGAVAVLAPATLEVLDRAVAVGEVDFPYVPGLLAFRELPALLAALHRLGTQPDLLLVDGNGLLHPRRFGLACHLGVLTGLPTIGVAKSGSLRAAPPPASARGSTAPIVDGPDELGRALRTQLGTRPVFVSVGHRIDLDTACAHVLGLAVHHRVPEPLRQAHLLARATLRAGQRATGAPTSERTTSAARASERSFSRAQIRGSGLSPQSVVK
jgi:deoxyribonuclease V